MSETRNLEVLNATFAAAARGDLEAVLANWADDGMLCDWTLDRIVRGKSELRSYLDVYFKAFSGLPFPLGK